MRPRALPVVVGAALLGLSALRAAPGSEQMTPPGLSPADPFDALLKAFNTERESRGRAGGAAAGGGGREIYETRSYLEGMRQALNRGEDVTVISTINQIEATASSEEVRQACVAIVKKIEKDRVAREQAFAAEVDVAIKRAAEIVLRAKSPREIDGLLADFNRLAAPHPGLTPEGGDNGMAQRLQGVTNFLNSWQEYLDARKRGDDQAITTALTTLAAADYNHVQVVPRSEILARLSGASDPAEGRARRNSAEINAAVADILDRAHTLDDLPTALAKLSELTPRGTNGAPPDPGSDLSGAIANLQAILRVRAELQAGIATTISVNTLRAEGDVHPGIEAKLIVLRAELIKAALPRLLDAPDEKALDGELVSDLLRRLIEQAKKRGNWVVAARGLALGRELASGQSNHTEADAQEGEAFRQYFAGLNLEAAGQYVPAVAAYLGALKTGSQELPAATVGEHLSAIAKAHPKEFAEASGASPAAEPMVTPEVAQPEP